MERQKYGQTNKWTDRKIGRQSDVYTDAQLARQTDR